MDLKEQDALGDRVADHWYYRSKAKAVSRLLAGTEFSAIMDVGAGSGFFSRYLLAHSPATEAWCVDTSYEREFDGLEAGKPIHFRRSVDSVDASLVLMMDVLEHVDDDVGLLRSSAGKVPNGCAFLVSVPAFQFLWSGHDVFLEHRRRYTLPGLERVLASAGLTVRHGAYYFGAVFPIAAASRLLQRALHNNAPARSQLHLHHRFVNEMLSTLSHAELPLMRHNRLAGLTAFCLAQT
jgi:2-polyprenyl-3-methyl-5-hydroxy-6-metoxy-1,4-benzoquinol methylase